MKYKIIFLIPIFEEPDCVEDLIRNISVLCPNSAIIFHVSSNSREGFIEKIKTISSSYDFVYIIPQRFPTGWANGYVGHAYMYMQKFALENLDFDYIYCTASNSLIINNHLEKDIYANNIWVNPPWQFGEKTFGDQDNMENDLALKRFREDHFCPLYFVTIEGRAYSQTVAMEFHELCFKYKREEFLPYGDEEVFLGTLFAHLIKDKKYYPKCLEVWGHSQDDYAVKNEINCVFDFAIDLVENDRFDILSHMKIYSLKKIPRVYTDPHRTRIRNKFNY